MSEILKQLFGGGIITRGIFETVYMTVVSALLSYVIGLPLGVILNVTDKSGLHPLPALNKTLNFIVNVLRSIPFIILMVAFLPVAELITGTSMGNPAMIVTLVIAAAPYVARMAESSLKEIDKGVIEAAKSMGASNFKIILKVMLPEAKPSLITGSVISAVTIIGYTAMAPTIGGGGLGQIAIVYGYQRFANDVIWVCVVLLVIIVQIIQETGTFIAKKTDKRTPRKN